MNRGSKKSGQTPLRLYPDKTGGYCDSRIIMESSVASRISAGPTHLLAGRVDFASPSFGLSMPTRTKGMSFRAVWDGAIDKESPLKIVMQQIHFPSYCCGCALMRVPRSWL